MEPQIGMDFRNYAPLQELLGSVRVEEATGKFQVSLKGLQPGDRISAIATDPRFGTSEPAKNAIVRTIEGAVPLVPVAYSNSDTASFDGCMATY